MSSFWILFILLFCNVAYSQETRLLKNYQPLRQAISAEDLISFAQQIEKTKPDLFRLFFIKDGYFPVLADSTCEKSETTFPLPWFQLGQGYYGLALTTTTRQQWDDFLLYAKASYLQGIHESTSCPLNYLGLGEIFLLGEKPAEAVLFFEELLSNTNVGEVKSRALVGKGMAYALLGKPALARKALIEVEEMGGWKTASFYYFLAQSNFIARDLEGAKRNIQRALELAKNPKKEGVDPFPISAETILYLQKIIH